MKPPVFDPSWSEQVLALYRHDMQEIWDRSLTRHVWNQYQNQLSIYLSFAPQTPIDILDVGCAQGTLALLLAERGHRVTAVDLRQEFLDYAKTRYTHGQIRFLRANVLEDALEGRYDLIFANQIVEHLVYPERLIERLRAHLKPGGRLVMTTPNGDYLVNHLPSYRELGDPKAWEHLQHTADADGHFYAYLEGELSEFFRGAGLQEVECRFFETPFISGHMKLRYLHPLLPSGVLKLADRLLLAVPRLGRRWAHQLLVTGLAPEVASSRRCT